ncbi:DUF916 domain-containing protein [Ruoffia tabacinasalis]|uniref:DUF916 domain-containing protein n=1 Tax=Ruoffia tabacinasalis TaxID=87458 RepID=A0ABS0LLG9_9LACT|nr:DUF916 domain-containing protein [Ruoffia tabacinasalis]MBG9979140.1 DUF916 domain-containing protein [Ruoffia tabacinasalis]
MKKLFLTLLLFYNILSPQFVLAEDGLQAISYSVGAVLPDNQLSEVSYFDIELDLGQEQELEVVINNSSDQDIEVKVTANTTVTNVNGVLVYNGSLDPVTESTSPKFDEIVSIEEEIVEVPANGQANAIISVKAPDEAFPGEILGGLHFELHEEESEEAGITNRFNYEIALNMVSSQSDEVVEPKLAFKEVLELNDLFGPRLEVVFSNLTPVFLSDMDINAAVYSKDDLENALVTAEHSMYDIAPTYDFRFRVDLEDIELQAGDYILKVSFGNDEEQFEFEEEFSLSESE